MTAHCRIPTVFVACATLMFLGGVADAAGKSKKRVSVVSGRVADAASKPKKRVPMPRPKPAALLLARALPPPLALAPTPAPSPARSSTLANSQPGLPAELMPPPDRFIPRQAMALQDPFPSAPLSTDEPSVADLAAVKRAIDLIQKGKVSEAYAVEKTIKDPVATKLVEWMFLRTTDASFERYAAFIRTNPNWPSGGMLRRRAEGALWEDNRDASLVRAFFADTAPQSAKGRFALARALLSHGDRAGAVRHLREGWRDGPLTSDGEAKVIAAFGDLLTRADHKARMDRFLYSDDRDIAMRAAQRLGGDELALAKARAAVNTRSSKAHALLDAVPASMHDDPGYMFSRIQWLRREGKITEAARLMLAVPRDPARLHDLDEWWVERRVLARELLDIGNHRWAYRVAQEAPVPAKENYQVQREFTAGWIALRFLNDPAAAIGHFSRIPQDTSHPISLARAGYWMGRTYEALGETARARTQYQEAARHSVAYYGQLARARLGIREIDLRHPPSLDPARRPLVQNADIVRAVAILYAVEERELVVTMAADLKDIGDVAVLAALGQLARKHHDPRGLLYIGKAALAAGLPLDAYAFPEFGLPKYSPIGPEIDRSILYAVARQESAFKQATLSSANAMGLMQVTPAAGRYIAKKFGASYNRQKLASDPVYNVQMGAAELGDLVRDYDGCYALIFAGYNAGRGRVRDWIARYGDPRDPKVDPVDWVERIPFSETRNYVQRVIENMQVYRARFRDNAPLTIEADLRGPRKN